MALRTLYVNFLCTLILVSLYESPLNPQGHVLKVSTIVSRHHSQGAYYLELRCFFLRSIVDVSRYPNQDTNTNPREHYMRRSR